MNKQYLRRPLALACLVVALCSAQTASAESEIKWFVEAAPAIARVSATVNLGGGVSAKDSMTFDGGSLAAGFVIDNTHRLQLEIGRLTNTITTYHTGGSFIEKLTENYTIVPVLVTYNYLYQLSEKVSAGVGATLGVMNVGYEVEYVSPYAFYRESDSAISLAAGLNAITQVQFTESFYMNVAIRYLFVGNSKFNSVTFEKNKTLLATLGFGWKF